MVVTGARVRAGAASSIFGQTGGMERTGREAQQGGSGALANKKARRIAANIAKLPELLGAPIKDRNGAHVCAFEGWAHHFKPC